MTIIGLIGGIAPESTIAYYRQLIAGHRAWHPESYPQILINSIDMARMLGLLAQADKREAIDFLSDEVKRVAAAGATFAAFASNTPHLVFPAVRARASIPLISIVEATADEIKSRRLKRVGLLGTRFTMDGGFYQTLLAERKVECIVPDAADREFTHEVYFRELVNGVFRDDSRAALLEVIRRLQQAHGVEAVILGGTELPLILTEESGAPVPLLDTTRIHVAALLRRGGILPT
jgi:aspartate racemase